MIEENKLKTHIKPGDLFASESKKFTLIMESKIALAFLAITALTACTRPHAAQELLQRQGYKNIEIQGYSWFGCDGSDFYNTKFKAISPAGYEIKGVVCEGLYFKNSTIRFN